MLESNILKALMLLTYVLFLLHTISSFSMSPVPSFMQRVRPREPILTCLHQDWLGPGHSPGSNRRGQGLCPSPGVGLCKKNGSNGCGLYRFFQGFKGFV